MKLIPISGAPSIPRNLPKLPGVYLFYNSLGELVYVGKARNLSERLSHYRRQSQGKDTERTAKILAEARSLEWRVLADEAQALLEENRIIQENRPKLNIAGAWYFLYPSLLYQWSPSTCSLSLAYTTVADGYEEVAASAFGSFRSRRLTKKAYLCLRQLFDLLGHREPKNRTKLNHKPYTIASTWRQFPKEIGVSLASFLDNGDKAFLSTTLEELLEKPRARKQAVEITSHLKYLRFFSIKEIRPLYEVKRYANHPTSWVSQSERDPLFIQFKTNITTQG